MPRIESSNIINVQPQSIGALMNDVLCQSGACYLPFLHQVDGFASFQIWKPKFEKTSDQNVMKIGTHDLKCFPYIVSEAFFKKLI